MNAVVNWTLCSIVELSNMYTSFHLNRIHNAELLPLDLSAVGGGERLLTRATHPHYHQQHHHNNNNNNNINSSSNSSINNSDSSNSVVRWVWYLGGVYCTVLYLTVVFEPDVQVRMCMCVCLYNHVCYVCTVLIDITFTVQVKALESRRAGRHHSSHAARQHSSQLALKSHPHHVQGRLYIYSMCKR